MAVLKTMLIFILVVFADKASLEERFTRISENLKQIKAIAEDSYVIQLYRELNELQLKVFSANADIAHLETIAASQLSNHGILNMKEAEKILKVTDKIIEKIALLDTKLINVDDKEILEKIEEYVLKMDDFDNHLRKGANRAKEKTERFRQHIKDDHRHYWLVVICIIAAVVILSSWSGIYK